ncbi:tyrosine-type recombinase/integrase [Vibrio sp. ArtGut-C1]|uniref:tyrosine-type recombinase/integrase n=1 Tax=Vibrio sp. ArtGut-C1 TaxID=2259137 RepID=UPI000A197736|nr:tyrosine-type recombinase/integrase [Vibrio sp. ArtGut-C1]
MSIFTQFQVQVAKQFGTPCAEHLNVNPLQMTKNELQNTNFPVTFDGERKPLSMWNSNEWDYSGYEDGNTNRANYKYILRFDSAHDPILLMEIKLLIYAMFASEYIKSSNATYAVQAYKSMKPYLLAMQNLGFKSLAELNGSIKLHQVMSELDGLYAPSSISNALGLLNKASRIELSLFHFNLGVSQGKSHHVKNNRIVDISKQYARKDVNGQEQTLYIPCNVHSKIIRHSLDILDQHEERADDFCKMLFENSVQHDLAVEKVLETGLDVSKCRVRYKDIKTLGEVVNEHGFSDCITGNCSHSLPRYYRLLAAACYNIIATFTGMRYDEFITIKTDGFRKQKGMYYVRAYESKISGGEHVDYITAPIVERAFDALVKLHQPVRILCPENRDNDFVLLSGNSKKYLPGFRDYSTLKNSLIQFIEVFDIRVDGEDMKQHKLINSESSITLKIGSLWPIATHQFRRTLAVNFVTNNLGTLAAVKQQLKHMYIGMTEHYSKNSTLAVAQKVNQSFDFKRLIETESEDIQVSLYKRIHYTNEIFSGKKGKELRQTRSLISDPEFKTDQQIRLMVKAGIFKVTRTPFGYCTKGDLCDKNDVVDPSFCGASCETMIIARENALNWQKLHKRNKSLLSGGLIEGFDGHKTMLKAQNKVAESIMNEFSLDY